MNWTFWKVEPKDAASNETELIDGWRLKIMQKAGGSSFYDNSEIEPLWKIYKWYLTKDSDKYNMTFDKGYRIIHRCNVSEMELVKIKLPKKDWV